MMTLAIRQQIRIGTLSWDIQPRQLGILLAVALVAFFVCGCDLATPVPTTPYPTQTASPTKPAAAVETLVPTVSSQALPVTLTIWVPPDLAQSASNEEG